ncbi:uncharacterized protein METZ01_LOCUS207299 [marine metagenome]|uniref:Uncharacterized protein n=1 Tax=marine metagenome TaxID=408172 RepID=A0A382EVH7_9ZZZZ
MAPVLHSCTSYLFGYTGFQRRAQDDVTVTLGIEPGLGL